MNKSGRPETIRAFVAIYPGREILGELESAQKRLREAVSSARIRWLPSEQIHLTLQFLGDVESGRLEEFRQALRAVGERHGPISLRAESAGCFPDERRPRIIWAGLTGEVERLGALKEGTDRALAPLGFVPEKRPFHPHLTLARVKEVRAGEAAEVARALAGFREAWFGEWQAGELHFMRSELSPGGAVYSALFTIPFSSE
jgi:RNA 2',3'-cyclic 3'-phosphodiesterase